MYRKSYTHITEINDAFNQTFKLLDNKDITKTFKVKQYIKTIDIDENSSIGDQIKHYRQELGIMQKDVAKYINIDRYTMYQIENKKYKQVYNPDHIKKILKFLKIENKIKWTDPYLKFIILDEYLKIKDFREKNNITRYELANLLNVKYNTLKRWENGKAKMSRKNFNKYMKIINNLS